MFYSLSESKATAITFLFLKNSTRVFRTQWMPLEFQLDGQMVSESHLLTKHEYQEAGFVNFKFRLKNLNFKAQEMTSMNNTITWKASRICTVVCSFCRGTSRECHDRFSITAEDLHSQVTFVCGQLNTP